MAEEAVNKAKKFGELLARSPLAEELKQALLDNLEFMPERNIDFLITALENEVAGLEIVTQEAESFLKKQEEDWEKLEKEQEEAASKIVRKEIRRLDVEEEMEALRNDLAAA